MTIRGHSTILAYALALAAILAYALGVWYAARALTWLFTP